MNDLNQKLEQEIKNLIKDVSCYKCSGESIKKVEDIHVWLDTDYAKNLPRETTFTGTASFSFEKLNGNLIVTPSPIQFSGIAEVEEFKVTDVHTPIIITKR